ncbi:hypothetical protein GCM10010172_71750 [Paractinoplanes ferrugineus]|uniref:Uncharacterized protein n=1 Tax=Paractinoplanes ferrugineus TaxID=113564 RepID=A0A919MJT3_9ACTN|nr:hypothetical protein [Actinoplanes ferrugineus]GIE15060.1 hypothetical protein Afe05nite_69000 [Actinoplanes ferrugineus]
MREIVQTRAFETLAARLQQGETPIVGTRALVGKLTVGRLTPVLREGFLLGTGGIVAADLIAQHRKQFVVLTDLRLLFLTQTFMGGAGDEILGAVPRETVTLAEVKLGFVSLVRLAFGTGGDGVSLTFPRVDKANARALADALAT